MCTWICKLRLQAVPPFQQSPKKKKRQKMWTACRVGLWVKLFVHLNLCYMCLHILNFFVTIYFFDLWNGLCWKGGTTCSLGLTNSNHTMPVIVIFFFFLHQLLVVTNFHCHLAARMMRVEDRFKRYFLIYLIYFRIFLRVSGTWHISSN